MEFEHKVLEKLMQHFIMKKKTFFKDKKEERFSHFMTTITIQNIYLKKINSNTGFLQNSGMIMEENLNYQRKVYQTQATFICTHCKVINVKHAE